jgi:hypothetical protein
MSPPFRFRAFISYCHQDRKSAARLQVALENFRLPAAAAAASGLPERLRPIFRDREVLGSSHDLSEAITAALDHSEYLVVMCSPRSAASRWVAAEVRHFIERRGPEHVFCFIVEGVPNAPDPALECLPGPLRSEHTGREVLAADARPQADGWRDAVLKTLAGLTGLPFADLAGREQRRLRHRALAWAVSGLVLAALFGVLAAYSARNAAAASKSARSAELIADYLEEVLSQFSPREKENTARAALLPLIDASTTPERLSQLADEPMALLRVRRTLGHAYLALNAPDRALPLAEENAELAATFLGPDHIMTDEALRALGNTYNALGQPERGAEIHQRLLDRAIRLHGEKSEQALAAMTNLAVSLDFLGRPEESRQLLIRVYELGVTFLPPDHLPFQSARLNYARRLDLEAALVVLEQLRRDQLRSPGPDNLITLEAAAFLAEAYEASGALEQAAQVYASAAEGLSRIQGPDHAQALSCAFRLAHVLTGLGRAAEAREVSARYFGDPPDERKLGLIDKSPADLPP